MSVDEVRTLDICHDLRARNHIGVYLGYDALHLYGRAMRMYHFLWQGVLKPNGKKIRPNNEDTKQVGL